MTNTPRKVTLAVLVSLAGLFSATARAVNVTVDTAISLGYMNVFELPANGGGYVFGSGWALADLSASFSGNALTLAPNTINDPSTFWYVGGGAPGSPGNKTMAAAAYAQVDDTFAGQTVNFSGTVLSNTWTSAHSTVAFIRDFAPDFSSFTEQTVLLTTGDFSLTLAVSADPGRHVQYGFLTTGPNVWITDVASYGTLVVGPSAVPEPSSFALLGGAAAGLFAVSRRRRRG